MQVLERNIPDRSGGAVVVPARRVAAFTFTLTRAEQLEVVGRQFERGSWLPAVVGVGAGLDRADHHDLRAFAHILIGRLRELAPARHAEPCRLFAALVALSIIPAAGDGNRE